LDLKGNVTDCNRAIQRMLGIHKDVIIDHPFTDLLTKEDMGDVAAQLSKVVMGISRAAHLEVRMPASGGREVMASLYASRMEDAFGEVTGLIIHFIDTTEQKHLEIQFAQSQKMQAIGQLAGGIAHDFNNLLTAMIGFSDLLLARHGPDDPSFADIQQIKQNANRATNLVRQLLTFSRKDSIELAIFDPNEALSDLSSMLGRLLESPIELNMENEPELGMVKMDRNQFDQVIINLAVNAKDAMRRGGQLTVRTANLKLKKPMQRGMDLVPAGEFVTIDVIDTGTGIRKEDMGRIFEPFFSTKEVGEGTGLGLSTVYGIVHQSSGYVFVDSAPGEGTTFTVLLPCYVSKSQRRPKAVEGSGPPSLQGDTLATADLTGVGTILLVEDEDAVRMFATRALKNKGYEVLEAANGEVALDVINSTDAKIDLIVTDVVMPGMDGHTLVQFVRQEMPDVKVIFISGYTDNVIPGGFGKGDYSFLPKPFSLRDLASKVKEVLEK
ncbi:MAG: response regulator, partial [Rhodospirillaceae bacterium]|nr:response regulator [Rhodospirillaceae bacterium]